LGEDYHPMPAYDSDGNFCDDKDYNMDAAESGDAKPDDDSYNWWIGSFHIFYLKMIVIWNIT